MNFWEMAYLVLVLATFGGFSGVLAYYSQTSANRPDARLSEQGHQNILQRVAGDRARN